MRSLDRGRERVDGITIGGIKDVSFSAALCGDRGSSLLTALSVVAGATCGGPTRSRGRGSAPADAGGGAKNERGATIEPEQRSIMLQPIFDCRHCGLLRRQADSPLAALFSHVLKFSHV